MRFAYYIERFVIECPDCGAIIDNKETRTLRHDLKQDQTRISRMAMRCRACNPDGKKPWFEFDKEQLELLEKLKAERAEARRNEE
jgi:hypothetical protein